MQIQMIYGIIPRIVGKGAASKVMTSCGWSTLAVFEMFLVFGIVNELLHLVHSLGWGTARGSDTLSSQPGTGSSSIDCSRD